MTSYTISILSKLGNGTVAKGWLTDEKCSMGGLTFSEFEERAITMSLAEVREMVDEIIDDLSQPTIVQAIIIAKVAE